MSRARELANYRGMPDRIVIPDLEGLIMRAVLRQSGEIGFQLAVDHPPAPINDLASSGRWVVDTQDPEPGATRYRGDTVMVTLRRFGGGGGEAGDREPRNPRPSTLRGLDIPRRSDDAPVERLGTVRHLDPLRSPDAVTNESAER